MSRVSNQNGVFLLYIMLEIHHSGQEHPIFNYRGRHTLSPGWCMLDVFLFLTFTRLGYECQDFLSPSDGLETRPRSIVSPEREWSGVRTCVNSEANIC